MKNLLAIVMGLLFLSATGMLRADDAKLQNDKDKAEQKVNADQKNLDASNHEINKDKDAIQDHNNNISNEKRKSTRTPSR